MHTDSPEQWFMRFSAPDQAALETNLQAVQVSLQQARLKGEELLMLDLIGQLGSMLTINHQEQQAYEQLQAGLELADRFQTSEEAVWYYLALGTCLQYLTRADEAHDYFDLALRLARIHKYQRVEHFVLQHFERSLVEQHRLVEAR